MHATLTPGTRRQPGFRSLWPARAATHLFFTVDGLGFGLWAAHLAAFRERFGVDDAGLSFALGALVVGSVVTMPLAGQAISRCGSRVVTRFAAAIYLGTLGVVAFAPRFPVFVLVAGLFGAAKGALDVAINAQAVTVENAWGCPINASFQACWSLGALLGALLTAAALHAGWPPHVTLPLGAGLMLASTIIGRRHLLPDVGRPPGRRRFQPTAELLLLGALAFLALFGEGAIADWSTVYFRTSLGAAPGQAATGYAAFSLAMTCGRLLGDRVTRRFGPPHVLQVSGLLVAAGMVAGLVLHTPAAGIVGFTLTGFGLANGVPILFGAAGRNRQLGPGPGIATVTTLGYFGFLVGPAVIGFLSHAFGLRTALGAVAACGLVISLGGSVALRAGKMTDGK